MNLELTPVQAVACCSPLAREPLSAEAAEQPLPSRARELIGKDPEIGETFDVEATVEGRFDVEELSRRGLAFES